ncbi:MAG: L-histidine N(alpha)-methyltransferase [Thermoplasmatota archaeon]
METETWTSAGIVDDTRKGLLDDPKWLSSLYFYDKTGSELFDAICDTPEYYPTRTEAAILEAHAAAILDAAGNHVVLAELGSGASRKTRIMLRALLAHGDRTYLPVDVSKRFLDDVAVGLRRDFPGLHVEPIAAEYRDGLKAIGNHDGQKLVMFLGSSLGNFEPEEQAQLMAAAHAALAPGDCFLLGTDLVKDPQVLHDAYNDAAGVTAAFNKNILANLNGKLDGDADLDAFEHHAFWNADRSRIEMHLRSRTDQVLRFAGADLEVTLAEGETIHTENSYKFTIDGVRAMVEGAGWTLDQTWTDDQQWFGLHLLRRS